MWRRTYLLLLLIRVYFALSPSYLHPDENFQGPEVFAGRIFSYPSKLPWEFASDSPIRSSFPLWPVYDVPMSLLQWFYSEMDMGNPPPEVVYYVIRGVMFLLSFVLEDWAIYELVPSPRHRRATAVLVASSYVTWTYQTHAFSNSLETLLVAWGLVLIRRMVENKVWMTGLGLGTSWADIYLQQHSSFFSGAVLSFIAVAGVFNRITFPAFLLVPGLQLLPHFWKKPTSFFSFIAFGLFFLYIAILADTSFYNPSASLRDTVQAPTITPLNNLVYNSNASNLAAHGLHPHYQHFLANLPQLLGPAYVMMLLSLFSRPSIPSWLRNARAVSAVSATALLSVFPHQEPRFLLPCVPLLLSCFRLNKSRVLLATWVVFNAAMGFLMGVYHQGGVVPTQLAIPSIVSSTASSFDTHLPEPHRVSATVFWWKTYSPPLWLLGDNTNVINDHHSTPLTLDIDTRDLMGISGPEMIQNLNQTVPPCQPTDTDTSVFIVAPKSASFLDQYTETASSHLRLRELWSFPKHLNLDDLDFGSDGVVATLRRVVGRRGLSVWAVRRAGCV